jgi:uncharacterized membrane protein YbhN (UPF0104 family)
LVKLNSKIIKRVIKVLFTSIALYVLFLKIDIKEIESILQNTEWIYLLLAILFFNLSKILSSIRLNIYFNHIGVKISEIYALKLYYIGMFYNLFLPSGVGGDGYKIYLLKQSHNIKLSTLITASLLDRVSGVIPLLFFAGILFIFSDFYNQLMWLDYLIIVEIATIFPIFYIINRVFFNRYLEIFFITITLGSAVQLLQLISAIFILYAIGIKSSILIFLTLFLISSVVAILPITIGGVGVRELTFLYGLSLVGIDVNGGVTFSLLFFLITALSSLIGLFLKE